MSSAADALASEGAPVILTHPTRGPVEVRLRYSFASLRKIEHEFGGLPELMSSVMNAATAMDRGMRVVAGEATAEQKAAHATAAAAGETQGGMFDVIARALAPALLDEPWVDRGGDDVWLGEDIDTLARAMDFRHFNAYVEAFTVGFAESFKDMHGGGKDGATRPPTAAASRSRGPRGGTSSSGPPASRKKSSGA